MRSNHVTHEIALAVPVDRTDHSLGHPHAAIILVEYGDFECSSCKQTAPVLKLMLARHPLHLQLVFRHFPLEEVHAHALAAAMAAESAGGQHKFWPMHDLLFENQAHLKGAHLRRYAEKVELDMPLFDLEMADTVRLQRVREHMEGARRSGVRATPTFFVNSVLQDVSFGLGALEERIRQEVQACQRIP
jgi:protein-disulfide isomerase